MSRPQIGIDRLPPRRPQNEMRESMNCKSCRKRKIKCNRLRPSCEACQVFACPCVYDAVPKKRGPKTDVLEALLKRVEGLEKQLPKDHPDAKSPDAAEVTVAEIAHNGQNNAPIQTPQLTEIPPHINTSQPPNLVSPSDTSHLATPQTPGFVPDILLDIYFQRIHGKPYHVLDENATRQRLQANLLPPHLAYAIYAVSAKYASHLGGYNNAVRIGLEYARRSRAELDIDEPSIEGLQTLLLLAQAAYQSGQGKKAYMYLSSAISMAFALDLHRELPMAINVTPAEREGRRRLFWACYLMDRFVATGSKRPSLIADECTMLRLPSWQLHPGAMLLEGDFFPNGSNLQYMAGSGKHCQGSTGMLIGITRTLGITNRYLAAGGVKGDSHFPWHSLSNLSKIRQELDMWASETQDIFTSLDSLFGQPDSAVLVLSKLVYHLIHCLIYRPFLPVDLAELSGGSQHQSWQIEATNLCFLHANAIAELVEIGRASSIIDWPEFVGYCVCTAGTIHVHGAHYQGREGEVFSSSAEFLSREMHQLSELRMVWAGIQHQRETLQTIYGCHSELVKSLASNPLRFSPVFQLEDFFDRYPSQIFDGAHVTFTDIPLDAVHESLSTYAIDQRSQSSFFSPTFMNMNNNIHHQQPFAATAANLSSFTNATPLARHSVSEHRVRKRRSTNASNSTRPNLISERRHTQDSIHETKTPPAPPTPTSTSPANDAAASTNSNNANNPPNNFPFNNPGSEFSPALSAFTLPSNANNQNQTPNNIDTSLDTSFLNMPTPGDPSTNPFAGSGDQAMTPGAASHTTEPDKDPFLTLLEQLAENETRGVGGSELDFFLGGHGPPSGQGE